MNKISVIIPTYNEERDIEECIESLLKQNYPNFEIILIDDGSTDKTLDILSRLKSKDKKIKVYRQNHKGPGAARNLGAKKASGKILVFVDADMTFDKNFLRDLVTPILKGKVKGTFSKNEYVSNWNNVWSRCWNINEGWEEERRHPRNYPDEQPVFRAVLKSEFDNVGGFTPGGYTDDWSLSGKLGYLAINAPGAIFYHKNPENLKEIFYHAMWVGKRKYKLGFLGYFIALARSSFPVSFLIGLFKSLKYSTPHYFPFKLIYDFGIFIGILKVVLGGNLNK